MCVKSCLCNICYKVKTCSDCEYIKEHKDDECYENGITDCIYFVKRIKR